MRIVRCDDSPINSIVAAGAASYILVSSHSALLALSLCMVAQSSSLALPLNVALTIGDAASFACYARHRTPGNATPASLSSISWRGSPHRLPRLRQAALHRPSRNLSRGKWVGVCSWPAESSASSAVLCTGGWWPALPDAALALGPRTQEDAGPHGPAG